MYGIYLRHHKAMSRDVLPDVGSTQIGVQNACRQLVHGISPRYREIDEQ